VFKAKVEPLVQIQLAPGSNKVVELPKPADFQPRKTKVPLRMGEQRLIIATCEKGAVEDLDEMKDIKADIDKVKAVNPNYVDIAARDVFRHRDVEVVSDAIPAARGLFISKATKERASQMERRKDFRVGIPRLFEHLYLCTVFQWVLRQPWTKIRKYYLLRLHDPGTLPCRRKSWRHRPMLSLKDRYRACLQSARDQTRKETTSRDLVPDVSRSRSSWDSS
jgi:hypothetical protein